MGAVNRKKKLKKVKKEYNCSIFSLCDLRSTSFTVIHFVANYFEEKHLSRLLLCTFLPPNLLMQGEHSPGKSWKVLELVFCHEKSWNVLGFCQVSWTVLEKKLQRIFFINIVYHHNITFFKCTMFPSAILIKFFY